MPKADKQPSQQGLRPFLDEFTAHRVQAAQQLGRHKNLSDTVRELVDAGWQAVYERRSVECRPGIVPTETADTRRKAVAYYLSTEIIDEVRRVSAIERITNSACVTRLLLEALAAREKASA